MQIRSPDWRFILLAIVDLFGALVALGLAALLAIYSVLRGASGADTQDGPTAFQIILLASALAMMSAGFIPAAYYNIRRMFEKNIPNPTPKPLHIWQGFMLITAWVFSAILAQILFNSQSLKWLSPPFYLLAVILPGYFLLHLASGGLNIGSRLRTWSTLSVGMTLGPLLSFMAELALIILGLVGIGIYLALHPAQASAFQQFADKLRNAPSLDELAAAAGPWAISPLTFFGALLFFSVFTPFIEETAKSLTVWLMFSRLASPAQGFIAGALSGAGFGLLESLLVSASPDSSWSTTLLVRGMSTMMHILASSLAGWGIASYRLSKRPGRMIGMYALAISLHGLWNASVVTIVFGGLALTLNNTKPTDLIGLAMIAFGILVLVILSLGIPISMGIFNQVLKSKEPSSLPLADAINPEGVK